MFFALVANDKKAFDEMFAWTEKNLGENQPAWLWGIPDGTPNGTGKILDTNNATDSDMWIAYCLIEAARIWNDPPTFEGGWLPCQAQRAGSRRADRRQGHPPGRVGFEEKGVITINQATIRRTSCAALPITIRIGSRCWKVHQRHGALLSERRGAGLG